MVASMDEADSLAQDMTTDVLQEDVSQCLKLAAPLLEVHYFMNNIMPLVAAAFVNINEKLSPLLSRLNPSVLQQLGQVAAGLQQGLAELPSRTRDILLLLSEHGWFFYNSEAGLSELWQFEKDLSEGKDIEVNEALAEYFEARITEIEESIVEKFPNRSHIVRPAFGAHRRGEYVLSIPVLLAQADGICMETVDKQFFLKTNGKPDTAAYVSQIDPDSFSAALLSPLETTLPISKSMKERGKEVIGLNRHTILHGESLDYGIKINSLKAISLINYVADVLTETKNEHSSGEA